ncbi:MAG TPA: N-6 DNA methylase [Kofleriaceae bacterium]|nr:N-6 DNA methylase [Kofleriaceae bacterium]
MAGAADRVGGASRRALGQWWTPPAVVDLALALADLRGARVCDPACGDGAFVARAPAFGAKRVTGIDIDPSAAAAARAHGVGSIVVEDMFEHGGVYDVVVGNPPFVRADRIGAAQRAAIARAIGELPATTDLGAACLVRAVQLASRRVVMVVSQALLDADYASHLWRAIEAIGSVRAIVAAPEERWFVEARVNAMIVVVDRDRSDAPVTIARLGVPTADAAARIAAGASLDDVAEVRATAHDPSAWRTALRAPAAWFAIASTAGGALVPLSELAHVRRGITTGANDVFYMSRADASTRGIERGALAPVVRSPYNGSESPIAIDLRATPLVALVLPPDRSILARYPRAAAHVRRHAAAGRRPSLRSRDPWWSLPARPARLFLAKAYGPRFIQRLAPKPVLGDQRVYAIEPRDGVELEALAAVLNGVFTALAIESLGRASMGHGALEHTVADAEQLPVLDVRRATAAQRARLIAALEALAPRPVEHVLRERERADRAALDRACASLVPDLSSMIDKTWDALCASVKLRDRWLLPSV